MAAINIVQILLQLDILIYLTILQVFFYVITKYYRLFRDMTNSRIFKNIFVLRGDILTSRIISTLFITVFMISFFVGNQHVISGQNTKIEPQDQYELNTKLVD